MRPGRPDAANESSPPLALTTRRSLVPMSRLNGSGLTRSKRTRVPSAVAVKASPTPPPFTTTASEPSPPSLTSLPSPGFQISWSSPAPAEGLVAAPTTGERVVAPPAIEQVIAAASEQVVVAAATDQAVRARSADEHVVAGPAVKNRVRQRPVGLVEGDAVVAAAPEHHDAVDVRDGGTCAVDVDGSAVDVDGTGRVAAHRDRVRARVPEDRQDTVALVELGGRRCRCGGREGERHGQRRDRGAGTDDGASALEMFPAVHRGFLSGRT